MEDNRILTSGGQISTVNLGDFGTITGLKTTNFTLTVNDVQTPFHIVNEGEDTITLNVKGINDTAFQARKFFAETESPLIIMEIEANANADDYTLAYGY